MSSIQDKIVDAVFEGNDELTRSLVKDLSYVKTRKILGLLESDEVTIRGNDVFIGGNNVGSFQMKDDKIEFTSANDGAVQTFENDEELMNHVSGLTEELKSPEGYVSTKLDTAHKDSRMETPKKNDHGHDDATSAKEPKASGGSSNPPDKEKDLKNKEHKDSRMETPKKNDHGHDDATSAEEPRGSGGGANPPDKQTELKGKHKDERMENPKKHDHGHDKLKDADKVVKGTVGK